MSEEWVVNVKADQKADELNWVGRLRHGDEVAMNCLVAKHRDRLIRVAANLLRDRHEAEDVAQEAFLKSFREIKKLRDDRAYSGYIYRICVRLCMDRLRSRKPTSEIVEQGDGTTGREVETKILVEELLQYLTEEQRETLVLREMDQLSYDEVAEQLNIPVGTVRSRLHAARERFRAVWIAANEGELR
ncbi:MAG: sigma-70 family RNA polymerase sigma factor [Fimbriimonadaceae bacterium]|nr:MAG: sigma-70 family RNA polymerase sigma factor [Fimbriimonadaceae bacterium]